MKHSIRTFISLPAFAIAFLLTMISCTEQSTQVTVHPIQDNPSPRLMPRALFADAPDSLITELGLEDGIPSSVCAFLVETAGEKMLFDAANGAEDSQLIPTLQALQCTPEEIGHIFITHLHGDHIGGLLNGQKAAFPNAQIHINEMEWNAWLSMPEKQTKKLREIQNAYEGKINTFHINEPLPCDVKAIAAYGHTPGHTMYLIGKNLIAGDIMHGVALQLIYPEYCARFDMNTKEAVEARKAMGQMAKEQGFKVYGMHFPAPYYLEY